MSCGLHDALRLEEQGVPVAMITTDAFVGSAAEQLAALSFTEFEPVFVPHPVAGLPAWEVHCKADAAIAAIVARLTTASAPAMMAPFIGCPPWAGPDCVECAADAAERGL